MLVFHMSHFIWNQKKQDRDGQRPYSPHWILGALLSKPRLRRYRPDNRSSLCDGELGWPKSQPQTSRPSGTQQVFSTCVDEGVHIVKITCTEGVVLLCTWDYSEDDSSSSSRSRANMCRWAQNHLQMGLLSWLVSSQVIWMEVKDFCRNPFFYRCSCSLVSKLEGTSYICLFAGFLFFKALKSKQDGIEAPHLLQWDQRLLGVFIWLCLCNWRAGLVGGCSTFFLSACSPGTIRDISGPAGSRAILSLSDRACDPSHACGDHCLQGTTILAFISCMCLPDG